MPLTLFAPWLKGNPNAAAAGVLIRRWPSIFNSALIQAVGLNGRVDVIEQSFNIRFSEIETAVPSTPGLYEIVTDEGKLLKVGISGNLRRRLIQHRQSKQSRLKLKEGGEWSNPNDVLSKQSILAKHLYFHSPVTGYDLKTEAGRQAFLDQQCHLLVTVTLTREEAREMERLKEQSGAYQFVGVTRTPS